MLRKKYGWRGSLLFVFAEDSIDARVPRDGDAIR